MLFSSLLLVSCEFLLVLGLLACILLFPLFPIVQFQQFDV